MLNHGPCAAQGGTPRLCKTGHSFLCLESCTFHSKNCAMCNSQCGQNVGWTRVSPRLALEGTGGGSHGMGGRRRLVKRWCVIPVKCASLK